MFLIKVSKESSLFIMVSKPIKNIKFFGLASEYVIFRYNSGHAQDLMTNFWEEVCIVDS
jgi:hypothetical protein